jgi:hypothetical protein
MRCIFSVLSYYTFVYFYVFTKYHYDKIKEDVMSMARSMHRTCEKFVQNSSKTSTKEITCKTQSQWEYNIKTDFKEVEREGVDRVRSFQDRDQWRLF